MRDQNMQKKLSTKNSSKEDCLRELEKINKDNNMLEIIMKSYQKEIERLKNKNNDDKDSNLEKTQVSTKNKSIKLKV